MIPTAVTQAETEEIQRLARNRIAIEVGSLLGYSTVKIAQVAAHVTSLDPHEGYPEDNPRPTLSAFLENLERFNVRENVTPIIANDDYLGMLRAETFGFAFIDVTGEYNDTLRVCTRIVRLLTPKAILCVHDCGHPDWPGALEAVRMFRVETKTAFYLVDNLAVFNPQADMGGWDWTQVG